MRLLIQNDMDILTELSLYSGYGGFTLGLRLAGLRVRTVCYVEINPYRQKLIQARIRDGFLDDAPIWDDARTFNGKPWHGVVDILTAGFPCQFISRAGRKDIAKNLWPETARIIGEIRPYLIFLENTPSLLSGYSHTPYILRVISDLTELEYCTVWGVVGAHTVRAPHLRDRVWVMAYTDCIRNRIPQEEIRPRGNCPKHSSWWDTEPPVGRVAYGTPHKVDRLAALGDGIVPAVVAKFLRRLKQK